MSLFAITDGRVLQCKTMLFCKLLLRAIAAENWRAKMDFNQLAGLGGGV